MGEDAEPAFWWKRVEDQSIYLGIVNKNMYDLDNETGFTEDVSDDNYRVGSVTGVSPPKEPV